MAALPAFAPRDGATTDDSPTTDDTQEGEVLAIDALRRALANPPAHYLREGLGLRLPEDEPALDEHEPFGAPGPLAAHGLRAHAFEAWLRDGERPDADALHARLLARALVAPGADGAATLVALLDDVEP